MIDIHNAIRALHSNVILIRGEEAFDADGILVVYDKDAVQAYVDAHAYKQQRVTEYPAIGDQLDALYHAGVFPDDMAAQIQAVKERYPKT